jgi:hypothetical protein
MAMQTITVVLTATGTATFTFPKPAANYGKTAPGITLTDGAGPVSGNYAPDVDNGNGTMTGTLNLTGEVTGTAEIQIYDKP